MSRGTSRGDHYGTKHPLDCCVYATQGQPVVLMQFTGLTDKNGVEIWEGDVVTLHFRSHQETYPVVWGKYTDDEYVSNIECWMVGPTPLSDSGGLYGVDAHTKEVIGNVYQHPELLA